MLLKKTRMHSFPYKRSWIRVLQNIYPYPYFREEGDERVGRNFAVLLTL
jgi:hypothetical protein